jgi:hypothetical protein
VRESKRMFAFAWFFRDAFRQFLQALDWEKRAATG